MYYEDRASAFDAYDPTASPCTNPSRVSRWLYTCDGDVAELEGPILVDIMEQNRLLVNGVSFGVRLYPSSNDFVLMANRNIRYTSPMPY